MTDLSIELDELLRARHARSIDHDGYTIDRVDGFLKEAYQINSRVAELLTFLRSIRRSYLSTAPPPRQSRFAKAPLQHARKSSRETNDETQYLTNQQRDSIDTQAKLTWREINAAITQLSKAEQTRQATESALTNQQRRKKGFGALGRWAAGNAELERSPEEEEEDGRAAAVAGCRESVIWFLQRGLEECGRRQSEMMEIRIGREVERGKSVLGDVKGPVGMGGSAAVGGRMGFAVMEEERDRTAGVEQQLSAEQQQMFAEENKNMLKLYEDRRAQVRETEKSLLEISELQSTLAANLDQQSSHIDQLVQDSFQSAEDVGKGNVQLKKAAERRSWARLIYYSTFGLSCFLVAWDLII